MSDKLIQALSKLCNCVSWRTDKCAACRAQERIEELETEVEELRHFLSVHVEEPVPDGDPMQPIGEFMADYLQDDQWNKFEPLLNGVRAKLMKSEAAEAALERVRGLQEYPAHVFLPTETRSDGQRTRMPLIAKVVLVDELTTALKEGSDE